MIPMEYKVLEPGCVLSTITSNSHYIFKYSSNPSLVLDQFGMRFFAIVALSLLTGILAAPVAVPNPEAYASSISLSSC